MKKQLDLVKEFHEKFHVPVLSKFSLIGEDRFNLRFDLMNEEVKEYLKGNQNKDLENIAKEICDILYGVYGTILEHGLQDKIEDVFMQVHKSNMSKDYSEFKMKKGENYFQANIKKILNNNKQKNNYKKMKTEKVLVIPRETEEIKKYLINGGSNINQLDVEKILSNAVYGTRYLMENNFNFKQIIPYIAFTSNDKVLVYKRSSKSGESRLHDKYSIGVGGHVDLEDDDSKMAIDVVYDAAIREVEEELGVKISRNDLEVKYVLNSDKTEVDKVHFGICFVINKNVSLDNGEQDILVERKFMSRDEVEEIFDKLESWSQIFYNGIVKNLIK